jgi:protein tyrosine phosphatase (PTP) superfamily phosphohydrolase (DUF442 family)
MAAITPTCPFPPARPSRPGPITRLRASCLQLAALLILLSGTLAAETTRDPSWATPVAVDGVPNLFKVSDSLYRSAQPTPAGLKQLKALGIRTVIDLREFHNDREAAAAASLLDDELSVPTWHVTDLEVVQVMQLLGDPTHGPYLVHCQHGADRTGLMIAMYRVIYQHWSKERAAAEMTGGGYGFHPMWRNIVDYLIHSDEARIRASAGLPVAAAVHHQP